jgi:hypothetical protein
MSESGQDIEFNMAYHPTPYPHAMRQDLQEIASVCEGIYLPFAEADLSYWANKVKYCIDIAHEMNLLVIADFWGYGNLFACGGIPSLFTVQHPEHHCVTNTGRAVPKSCPNKPAVRVFLREAIAAFVEQYEPDGVFWDEPHWALGGYLGTTEPQEWLCRCPDCRALFEARYGKPMPATLTPEVEEFRTRTMLDFLSALCGYVKQCGDHLITSTCVMPSDSAAFKEAVGKTENLDVFGIDPYWRPNYDVAQKAYVDQHTADAVRIAHEHGKLAESWVCAWNQNQRHERDAYRAAKYMAGHDIDCLSAWSYRDYVSWAPCNKPNPADPELVWKHLRRAYHEIRQGDLELHL